MRTHHIRHQSGDLGIVWFVVPMVWAAIGLVGFALIANWPELFAPEQPTASIAATAPAHAGADLDRNPPGGLPTAGDATAPKLAPDAGRL